MSQAYALHVLKVAVAKICQTIGWHSTHTTTIDLLIDVTQHFLREISRIMMRYCELYNRTEPNLNDLALAYRDIGINMQELMEYIQFVDPIALPFAVPRFPVPRESNLNFLKPGSREMMMRPLHIPMYMPPMFPELEDADRGDGDELGHGDEKALVRVASVMDASAESSLPGAVIDAVELKMVDEVGASLTEITIDATGEKMDSSETVTLGEDGALAPEALVNEEVEIPMQTLELKEPASDHQGSLQPPPPQPPPPPPPPPPRPASADGGGPSVSGEADSTSAKQPEHDRQSAAQSDTVGAKSNTGATVGEGRPTRSISSVIMTTSGFISPAREGKLPDSRIPIIPEERPPRMLQPPPAPLCAPPAAHPMSSTTGIAATASAQAIAGPAASAGGSSAHPLHPALLPTVTHPANPRDHKHGNASATTTGAGPAIGTLFAAHAASATANTPSSTVSGVKQTGGGEKASKKVKKKPIDRERKKGDKKGATGSAAMLALKGEKLPGSERANTAKPPPVGELPAGDGKEWNALQPSAVYPSVDAAAVAGQASVAPFLSVAAIGASPPVAFSASSTLPTNASPTVPGKPVKPPKTKAGKEKVLKKRKLLPPPSATEAGLTFPTADAITLATTTTTTTATTPEVSQPPLKQPKVKSSTKRIKQAKKLQALQAGVEQQLFSAPAQLDQVPPGGVGPNQPPPLIDPWRVGALAAGEKLGFSSGLAIVGDGVKPGKQKATGKQPKSELQVTEQAAQLSLLQKMHPSLEITASPAPDQHPRQPGSGKKGGAKSKIDGKGHTAPASLLPAAAAPPFAADRDVIVIDDDKSPPHTPSLLVATPGAIEGKKHRKQTPGGSFFSHEHGLGAGPAGELASPPGAGPLSFRDFSSPELHASAIPKTPDIKLPSPSSSSETGGRASKSIGRAGRIGDSMLPEASGESKPAESIWAANRTLVGGPTATPEKKQKRPKQKPAKGSTDGAKQPKLQHQPDQEPFAAGQGQDFGGQGPAGQPGAAGRNPFALFGPGGPGSLGSYSNYLNQSLSARMPFGLFPFPSGPGLIPDAPLFPLQPGPYPMGPGNFPLPTNPFGLPSIGTQINNLLRMPRPLTAGGRHPLGGAGSGSLNPYQNHLFDDNLDPEAKLAQTPLDLQKSNCNVAPLVPPSLFQAVNDKTESLNLSLKVGSDAAGSTGTGTGTGTGTTKQTATVLPQKKTQPVGSTATTASAVGSGNNGSTSSQSVSFLAELGGAPQSTGGPARQTESRKEDQVVILPAASVLLGASPPQRSSVCVIDIDDSDGSQSTATTTGERSKDGRRKGAGKEHKKDRKLKDGKVKKKKDKKDKNRSKEREREQQLKELSAGTASSSAVMTMGMIGAEEALMEQLRKERKEKKEKRKDKLKKEKRKERERMQLAGATDPSAPPASSAVGASSSGDTLAGAGEPSGACAAVPKLIMKLGGSATTPSPRSDTPDHYHAAAAGTGGGSAEQKRDGSPELARISALVTRPPKLKVPTGPGSSSGKSKKDDSPTKAALGVVGADGAGGGLVEHGQAHGQVGFDAGDIGKHAVGTGPALSGGDAGEQAQAFGASSGAPMASGVGASKGASKAARGVSIGGGMEVSKTSAGDAGGSRKAPKDSGSSKGSKSSSSAHHHHHHAAASTLAAPAHMTDADGNTVWICPACGRVDDGTPMIGCDGCDAWYHWVCVGIQVPPDDNEDWYCRVCIGKKQDSHTDSEKQRKRKKKDKKTPKD